MSRLFLLQIKVHGNIPAILPNFYRHFTKLIQSPMQSENYALFEPTTFQTEVLCYNQ